VDRQERLCRQVADRLGLVIAPGCVFVDNNRSAWQRRRRRPGWDALLAAIRAGGVRHVIKRPNLVGTGPAAGSWVDGGNCSTGGRTGVLFALVGGVAKRPDSLV
jgi:hypothetical protein